MTSATVELDEGRVYWLKWKARDIGYGVERGSDEYVYRGVSAGKRAFERTDGGATIYLFDDEIVYCEADPRKATR